MPQFSQKIFVYGSLKRGYTLHRLLQDQRFLGISVTQPLYRLFDLGEYPGLVEWPEGHGVVGEVYEVDLKCLKSLDAAEGVAEGCYSRRPISLESSYGEDSVEAWFWLGSVSGLTNCGSRWPVSESFEVE